MNDVDLRGRITVERGTTLRDCPRCRKTLNAVLLRVGTDRIEIDRCDACHGLFFDPREVDAVLNSIETRDGEVDHRQLLTLIEQETPTGDFEEVAYLPCPDCGQLMHRRQFGQQSGVIVDTCRDHGKWLDGGELRRLIRWTQAGGRRHHAVQEIEKQRLKAELERTSRASPSGGTSAAIFEPNSHGRDDTLFGDLGRAFDTFDAFDAVNMLGSLARWLR